MSLNVLRVIVRDGVITRVLVKEEEEEEEEEESVSEMSECELRDMAEKEQSVRVREEEE